MAAFEIRSALDGPAITSGIKITFCFVDVETFSTTGAEKKQFPRTYFECNGDFQGLAAHWADEYHQSTPLQELEVTSLPDGDYYLTHEADPFNHWLEGPNWRGQQLRLGEVPPRRPGGEPLGDGDRPLAVRPSRAVLARRQSVSPRGA